MESAIVFIVGVQSGVALTVVLFMYLNHKDRNRK